MPVITEQFLSVVTLGSDKFLVPDFTQSELSTVLGILGRSTAVRTLSYSYGSDVPRYELEGPTRRPGIEIEWLQPNCVRVPELEAKADQPLGLMMTDEAYGSVVDEVVEAAAAAAAVEDEAAQPCMIGSMPTSEPSGSE